MHNMSVLLSILRWGQYTVIKTRKPEEPSHLMQLTYYTTIKTRKPYIRAQPSNAVH